MSWISKWSLVMLCFLVGCEYHSYEDRVYDEKDSLIFTQDCDLCPELVLVEPGSLKLNMSLKDEFVLDGVAELKSKLYVARNEVTKIQYQACVDDSVCAELKEYVASYEDVPVVFAGIQDAFSYAKWLSDKTGKKYRLPSESEWMYFSQAGTDDAFWWGDVFSRQFANCFDCYGESGLGRDDQLQRVGTYPANKFGVYDTVGNALEWVSDCADGAMPARKNIEYSAVEPKCSLVMSKGGYFASKLEQAKYSGFYLMKTLPTDSEGLVSKRDWFTGIRVVREFE